MAGPWEDFQKAAPAADADGPWSDFAPKNKSSLGGDIAKSAASGVARGAATIAGLPVDLVNAIGKAIGRNPGIETGSSAQLTGAIEPYLHQPETTAGKVANFAGEWAPAFLGGPETAAAKLITRFAAPLAGSTAAGAAFEGTQGEDLARLVGGGGLSGLAMAKARGRANAQAAKSAEAAALEEKPLSPAGQKAHDAWSDVIDESDSKQDVIKGARRFKRTAEYDTLHPDVQQDIDALAAGNAKRRSETSTLLPLAAGEALGSVVPGAAPLFMVGRSIKDRLANRSALDAAEAIRLGIRRTDAGPTAPAPIARPGPTGPSVSPPRSPWPTPAPAAPGTGFTLSGAPYNPTGYDPAAVARARQAPPTPTPPGVPGEPPGTSLVPYRNPGFTMPGGAPIDAQASPVSPPTALPPAARMALLGGRPQQPALPPPTPPRPIAMPASLPIRAGGRPPMLALPAPQASGAIAPATPQLAGPAAAASGPVNLAKSITKARGKVTRVPIETPSPERPAPEPRPGESTAATTAANAGERAPASVSKPAPAPSTLGAEYDGIPDFLRRTAVKPAAPTAAPEQAKPADAYQHPTQAMVKGPAALVAHAKATGMSDAQVKALIDENFASKQYAQKEYANYLAAKEPQPALAASPERIYSAYRELKAQQGGISTVYIGDIAARSGLPVADVHNLILADAKAGRATLAGSSSVKAMEVPGRREAQLRFPGETPFDTVTYKSEPQPALAALTPSFAPKPREQMPFYGRSDHETVAAQEGVIAAARRAAEGKPGSASDMAKNIARVRSTIAPAITDLSKGATKADRALLTEMREQMFAAHGSAERLLARDHYLSQLSGAKQTEAKAKLTNKLVKAERKHGSTRPYDAATAKQARQEATKTTKTPAST